MNIVKLVTATALSLSLAAPMVAFSSSANAKITQKWEHTSSDVCYTKKRVPATVQYNTKGKLKHAATRKWIEKGNKVIDKGVDAVYFTTRTVIEEQHTTLVKTKC